MTTYYYLGNTAKMTDPAGNWKRYTSDTLGNLTKAEEPNPAYGQADNPSTNFVTTYTYDLEGHLTQVSMPRGGYTQTRTFNYDLPTGHLLSSNNPESGTVTYAYYNSGRLLSKADAKGQKVVYSYDGYGRVAYIDRYPSSANNPDPCQSVVLGYDSSQTNTNVMGRVSTATVGARPGDTTSCGGGYAVQENYSYTAGGLVTAKGYIYGQWTGTTLGGSGPSTGFSWDGEGHMTGYGAFTYTLDAMGRPTALTETGPGTLWVQNAAYGPGGELKTMQYRTSSGAYYTETNTYNNLAQLAQLQTGGTGLTGINLQYAYTSGGNNGQVSHMTDAISGEQVTYTYDSLKRLIKAETTQSGGLQWGQSFGYDGFGNLTSKTPTAGHTGTAMSLSIDQTTNHVTMSGFAYDANGNMTSIASTPSNVNLTYDVENRTGSNWYGLNNQPLYKNGDWYLYGLRGERLLMLPNGGSMSQAVRNIYFGARLIQSNGTTVVTDRLGSVRANENGETFEYYPYGEEITVKNPQDREKFATYTRESSTGLDYADQRYYANVYGQFSAPDRYQAMAGSANNPGTPQSWNRIRVCNRRPSQSDRYERA